jgi:hypothetical protein
MGIHHDPFFTWQGTAQIHKLPYSAFCNNLSVTVVLFPFGSALLRKPYLGLFTSNVNLKTFLSK